MKTTGRRFEVDLRHENLDPVGVSTLHDDLYMTFSQGKASVGISGPCNCLIVCNYVYCRFFRKIHGFCIPGVFLWSDILDLWGHFREKSSRSRSLERRRESVRWRWGWSMKCSMVQVLRSCKCCKVKQKSKDSKATRICLQMLFLMKAIKIPNDCR